MDNFDHSRDNFSQIISVSNVCVRNILVLTMMAQRKVMSKNIMQVTNSELCIMSGGSEGADCPTVAVRRQKDLENSKKIWE